LRFEASLSKQFLELISRIRDQEDGSLKPEWANSSRDPILTELITKNAGEEWLKV
jgi:hypothetical protein